MKIKRETKGLIFMLLAIVWMTLSFVIPSLLWPQTPVVIVFSIAFLPTVILLGYGIVSVFPEDFFIH